MKRERTTEKREKESQEAQETIETMMIKEETSRETRKVKS